MKNYKIILFNNDNDGDMIEETSIEFFYYSDDENITHIADELYHNSDYSYYGIVEIND